MIQKSGKAIERIGKVFDHCSHKYILDLKVFVCGFWDGKSFTPLDFTVYIEPGIKKNRGMKAKELKRQFSKERKLNSLGADRIKELNFDKISMGIQIIKRSIKSSFQPANVLVDSWFMSESLMSQIQNIKVKYTEKLYVIGRMKTNRIVEIRGRNKKSNLVPGYKRREVTYNQKNKYLFFSCKIIYK